MFNLVFEKLSIHFYVNYVKRQTGIYMKINYCTLQQYTCSIVDKIILKRFLLSRIVAMIKEKTEN